MITLKQKGNFSKLNRYLERVKDAAKISILDKYGQAGVETLSSATPADTGLTASSWYYKVERTKTSATIQFLNSNINDGVPIAVIIQSGHGTGRVYLHGHFTLSASFKVPSCPQARGIASFHQ